MNKSYLITGGTGFIGRSLVKALVERGDKVRSLDDESRGAKDLLKGVDVELITGDIRDYKTVFNAVRGVNCVVHLAYINGTHTFYEQPRLILDIAVRGMLNVLNACIGNNVPELSIASSPEAYQNADKVPTDETVGLSVPNPLNPRYSYGGGKIINELMLLNCAEEFEKAIVFRPHSVYGPYMGSAHVIPQLVSRIIPLLNEQGIIKLPIQGSGAETRSFCYIDDAVQGILVAIDKGEHRNIYHIGSEEEVTIETLAKKIGQVFDRELEIVPSELEWGSPIRRCPDTTKLRALGYKSSINLDTGLRHYLNSMRETILPPFRGSSLSTANQVSSFITSMG